MADNATRPTDVDPEDFIASVEHPTRRADAKTLLAMMERITACTPRMWGPSIIGFGRYHYRYASGREGDSMLTGFSPRKANLVLYVMAGHDDAGEDLAALGKHKLGASCLYVNTLADVDLTVLERILANGVAAMRHRYETVDD